MDRFTKYGHDMQLHLDFTRTCAGVYGRRLVIGDLIGRLVDELWYDPSYGVNLPRRLSRNNPKNYPSIAAEVERELERDDRVDSVECTIEPPDYRGVVRVFINGTLDDGSDFALIGTMDALDEESFTILGD